MKNKATDYLNKNINIIEKTKIIGKLTTRKTVLWVTSVFIGILLIMFSVVEASTKSGIILSVVCLIMMTLYVVTIVYLVNTKNKIRTEINRD